MRKIDRQKVYNKYNGRCAYSGAPLGDDWQIDHAVSKYHGGTDDLDNLLPACRIVNHYKRAKDIEQFRQYLINLPEQLKRLPKHPKSEKVIRHKEYLEEVAGLFGITEDKPFCGMFYFERCGMQPCPFCGRAPMLITPERELARLYRPSRNGYALYCPSCQLMFGWDWDYGGTFGTVQEAINAWNRRSK